MSKKKRKVIKPGETKQGIRDLNLIGGKPKKPEFIPPTINPQTGRPE